VRHFRKELAARIAFAPSSRATREIIPLDRAQAPLFPPHGVVKSRSNAVCGAGRARAGQRGARGIASPRSGDTRHDTH
jgi:hypothetical protein